MQKQWQSQSNRQKVSAVFKNSKLQRNKQMQRKLGGKAHGKKHK